jgi:hypothetical protein
MIKTNIDKLVNVSVIGEVTSPVMRSSVYKITSDGKPVVLPGVGGIRYNVRVGDAALGWEADHVEPGVSIKNREKDDFANNALNILACIGNKARVVSGDAKNETGLVTGKHGGIEHVMVDFHPKTLRKMVIGDKIMVDAFGVGLKILDFPDVKVMNIDPRVLKKLFLKKKNDKLVVPVTHIIPAKIMGSGIGRDNVYRGDYDIQLFDKSTVNEYGLNNLRLGDFVAITDADHSYGRIYKKNAVSVGIVAHTDCVISGHGPGVTTVFTSSEGMITPKIDRNANLAYVLKLRK